MTKCMTLWHSMQSLVCHKSNVLWGWIFTVKFFTQSTTRSWIVYAVCMLVNTVIYLSNESPPVLVKSGRYVVAMRLPNDRYKIDAWSSRDPHLVSTWSPRGCCSQEREAQKQSSESTSKAKEVSNSSLNSCQYSHPGAPHVSARRQLIKFRVTAALSDKSKYMKRNGYYRATCC